MLTVLPWALLLAAVFAFLALPHAQPEPVPERQAVES